MIVYNVSGNLTIKHPGYLFSLLLANKKCTGSWFVAGIFIFH